MSSETITLQYPIDVDGQKISSVTLRRPKVRDVQQVSMGGGDEFTQTVRLIANLTMLTPDQVMEMDMGTDFKVLREKTQSFLGLRLP